MQDDEERREFYSKIAETLTTERYIEFESCRTLKLIGKQNKHSSLFAQWIGASEQMKVDQEKDLAHLMMMRIRDIVEWAIR